MVQVTTSAAITQYHLLFQVAQQNWNLVQQEEKPKTTWRRRKKIRTKAAL
ncbi:MAG: hypothetical protein KF775_13340 [Cyclobacteriaceae bacterium]|nr:hypothetical protein [Cyclobacteriaceae bacterium]